MEADGRDNSAPRALALADSQKQLTSPAQRSSLRMVLNISFDVRMKRFLKKQLMVIKLNGSLPIYLFIAANFSK